MSVEIVLQVTADEFELIALGLAHVGSPDADALCARLISELEENATEDEKLVVCARKAAARARKAGGITDEEVADAAARSRRAGAIK